MPSLAAGGREDGDHVADELVDAYRGAFGSAPAPALLLSTDLVILDMNEAYLRAVGQAREELVGRYVFAAFPSTDDEVSPLEASMRRALSDGRPARMPLLKYDLPATSGSESSSERWWSVVNVPVRDGDGVVRWLLNAVEDVTEVVQERARAEAHRSSAEQAHDRTLVLERDLWTRSEQLARLVASEAEASRRLAGLAEAALELAGAETTTELADVIVGRGLVALGADGGAVAVRDEQAGAIRLTLTDSLGRDAQRTYAELPLDGPLPASVAARTGAPVWLPDRAAGLAFSAHMQQVYDTAGKVAWAAVPLRVGDRVLGSLTASWSTPQAFTAEDRELVAAFAAQCAQALDRLLVRQAERRSATATRRIAEALQRSLLTEPPQPDHLQIAVRYLPAAAEAAVGGDWYDAFLVEGATSLVIGDVAGHDQDAAAAMGQVRNMLRGVAHLKKAPPAAVLTALDEAMTSLAVGALATAVLAQVEQSPDDAALGLRLLRWSNAGHPPRLLLEPEGTATLLSTDPDLLLGLDPSSPRCDHTQVLRPGATVLLYTDGLVERRDAPLDEGLEWLRRTVSALAHGSLDELCDGVLAAVGDALEDDVALIALRAHPEDRSRPPEAGPASASTRMATADLR